MTPDEARERLRDARGFIFDMDGTLVLGDRVNHGLRPLPGAAEMLDWVRGRGLPYVVFTNGTNRAPAHFAGRARELRALNELLSQAKGADGRGENRLVDGTAGVGTTALAVYWARVIDRRAAEARCEASMLAAHDRGAARRRYR